MTDDNLRQLIHEALVTCSEIHYGSLLNDLVINKGIDVDKLMLLTSQELAKMDESYQLFWQPRWWR